MPKKAWLGLVPIAGLLLYQFLRFDVLQDDAFISFRYIRNFLDGHGLVFNLGERVEGYTNFFWIMLLALLTKLGLPLIETARWLGVLAAVGSLGIAAYAAHRHYPQRGWAWLFAAPFLLAANGALAYWSGSGLETALFTLLAAAGAVTYFYRPAFSLLFIALATLTRPEGGLLAFLFGVAAILLKQKNWKETLIFWGNLFLLLLPFTVFKYFYYGSLLPNPFYAKTGFSAEYLQSGVEYVWMFLKHYGGYGLFLILPFLFWKRVTAFSRFVLSIFLGYGLYVVSVGGDVLQAHRFFVPVLPFFYLPLADAFHRLAEKLRYTSLTFIGVTALAGLYAYQGPSAYLERTAFSQTWVTNKMAAAGRFFEKEGTAKTFAVSAAGALSYYVGERKVIDMLGLVDPVVAKTPENIEGLTSTWRERNYNAGYVLSKKPDVIFFSTSFKPSSWGERALFLYPDFRRNYRLEFLYNEDFLLFFYRRFRELPTAKKPDQSPRFVDLFNRAGNLFMEEKFWEGTILLHQALAEGPNDCATLYTTLGLYYHLAGYPESSEVYFKTSLRLDDGGPASRLYYRDLLHNYGRYAEAALQESILVSAYPVAAELLQARRNIR